MVDRRRAGDRHRVQPGLGRDDAHRPAEVVGRPSPAGGRRRRAHRRRRDRPGGVSTTPIPACGPTALGALDRLGALDDAGAAAGVRRRGPGGPPAGRRARRATPGRRPAAAARRPRPGRRRGRGVGVRRARGGRPTTCWRRSSRSPAATAPAATPLVREAAVAALGAIGDDRGLDAILAGDDRPAGDPPAGRAGPGPVRRPRPPPAADVAAALERAAHRPRLAGPPGRRGPHRRRADRCVGSRGDASEREAVQVGLAALEADALVQAVGGLARRAAGQADVLGAAPAGLVEGGPVERLADPVAARRLVDDDVLDPRLEPGRDAVRAPASGCRRCAPSTRATNSTLSGAPTIAASSSRVGGGDDDDSCGISRANASTSSSSPSPRARSRRPSTRVSRPPEYGVSVDPGPYAGSTRLG